MTERRQDHSRRHDDAEPPGSTQVAIVQCTRCCHVQVRLDSITVVVIDEPLCSYAFTCPSCNEVRAGYLFPSVRKKLGDEVLTYVFTPPADPDMDDIKIIEPLTKDEIDRFCDVLYGAKR